MPTPRKPTAAAICRFLERQRDAGFSYTQPGCTRGHVPDHYMVDRYRMLLGHGPRAFAAACHALRDWQMFRVGWVELHPRTPAIAEGQSVAVLIRACGLWWLNGAKIVYVDDRQSSPRQFAFAYGTLRHHAERGEERFCVTWTDDDRVWYELTAISRPGHWYTQVGLPLVRRLQRRFAADSQRAMLDAVKTSALD
jgi:uncharacterized protein (UPF0548 family)